MTPEEIVKELRKVSHPTSLVIIAEKADDLIERQACEIMRLRREYNKALDHGQRQAKALEEAEKALLSAQDKFCPTYEVITLALATIRAVRGEEDGR